MKEVSIKSAFARIAGEHRILRKYSEVLDEFLSQKTPDELMKKMQATEKDLIRDTRDHFDFEEKVFYPAAIVGNAELKTAQTVLTLQKQHGLIQVRLEHFFQSAHLVAQTNMQGKDLHEASVRLIDEVMRHIDLEMQEFFPFLEQNKATHPLIDSLLTKYILARHRS